MKRQDRLRMFWDDCKGRKRECAEDIKAGAREDGRFLWQEHAVGEQTAATIEEAGKEGQLKPLESSTEEAADVVGVGEESLKYQSQVSV